MSVLVIGDTVKLTTAPKGLAPYKGKFGTVRGTTASGAGIFADVELTLDAATGKTMYLRDILSCYLTKTTAQAATGQAKPRRGVLNLHEPKDERTESEKEAEAEAFLLSCGYHVLRVGQRRKAAVCYGCLSDETKAARQQNRLPRPVKPIICPTHQRTVYSMDSGSSPGVADWQLRHVTRWPQYISLSVEWKRDSKSTRRAKQLELNANGWYPIVDNLNSLCEEIVSFEDSILMMECLPEVLEKALLAK